MSDSVNLSADGPDVDLEISGGDALQKAQTILKSLSLGDEDIEYVCLVTRGDSEQIDIDFETQEEVEEETDKAEAEDESDSETKEDRKARLQEGSRPEQVLKFLSDKDKFMRTRDIREEAPNDIKNMNNLSSILWDLNDRGLVEKKGTSNKGHHNEYKITSKGRSALGDSDD